MWDHYLQRVFLHLNTPKERGEALLQWLLSCALSLIMCFGFTCDCSSQQSSTSQIYASPAERLRKHLIPRNSVHLHKSCPMGPQEHEWLASNAREMLNRLPHMQKLNDTRYCHYFGTSGVANWKRQHQTGNLQTCHTSKIIRRRGISCVLQ